MHSYLANEQIMGEIDELWLFVKTENNYYFGAWKINYFSESKLKKIIWYLDNCMKIGCAENSCKQLNEKYSQSF